MLQSSIHNVMAVTQVLSLQLLLISFFSLLLLYHFPCPCKAELGLKACKFNAIYQLGDSISDTGNIIYEHPALSAGLPLLNPYLSKDSLLTTDRGVNFAVAGSTALPSYILAQNNIVSLVTNSFLSVQLHWMSTHFNSICLNDCAEMLKKSLFMVGEIGGNNCNYALGIGNKTIKEAMEMVPQAVQAIKNAVQEVISYGALKVVVPGNFPIGCFPIYLTGFQTNNYSAYDKYHCLKELNKFSIYHNDLKIAIEELKQEHSDVTIIYGDYYNAFQWVFRHASNLAQSAGLPLLNPYLSNDSVFAKDQGVNFAVAGSTALSPNVLAEKNIISLVTNSSLSVQLHWMSTHFNSLCLNANDCAEKLKRSLFMVGEIGGNDFNYALQQANKTIQEAMEMVPQVVQAIKDAVQTVIGYGALKIVVPGNFPIGCFPVYLTDFQTNDSSAYDEYHCLKELNEFSIYQNDHLKIAIEDLKQKHPNVSILYGDYYNAFQWVYRHASNLGFDASSLQKSCCGIGGEYNYSSDKLCGDSRVPVCSNPHQRISWDGVHPTQKAYYYMSYWLIKDLLPQLGCGAV
ncbi:hypothetical protein FEM48_Zijuj02G0138900 [Ziziphus jujuba var. spinosa]|uniref:GDSL esterase/lipase At5g03980-like n=1 Tax=Ziziphus jujuba var. spinosa TaxID=714518 RepID=A0A978VW30_ZIZJJ|nr:hypothetical protein FEM48_Zijuj02G0138900 [Ziziphus jujuba var. spinosa]